MLGEQTKRQKFRHTRFKKETSAAEWEQSKPLQL